MSFGNAVVRPLFASEPVALTNTVAAGSKSKFNAFDAAGVSAFVATSVAFERTRYWPPAGMFDCGKLNVHDVVPDAVENTSDALENAEPFQYRPVSTRWTLTPTPATPEPASDAVPVNEPAHEPSDTGTVYNVPDELNVAPAVKVNDDVGATRSTVNVFDDDVVEFPAASDWVTVTVYVPSASAAAVVDHAAPERVTGIVCTVVTPCLTTTDTDAESPDRFPAVPDNTGVAEFPDELFAGDVTATPAGARVSTVNVLGDDVVVLPTASVCVTVTV